MLVRMITMMLLLPGSSLVAQGGAPQFLNPPGLTTPNGYTHVVVAPDGRTVYVAGQVAFDSTGKLVGARDFRSQAEQVYRNLNKALSAVGGSLDDVVKSTTFITDLKNVPALREVREKHLDRTHPPANTLLVVSSLARPDLLIEIEAVAVLRKVVRFTAVE